MAITALSREEIARRDDPRWRLFDVRPVHRPAAIDDRLSICS
jgi:hypothetical protein